MDHMTKETCECGEEIVFVNNREANGWMHSTNKGCDKPSPRK